MPINTSLNSQQMQWSALTPQNTIITLHTLPFVEGGQEITLTEAGTSVDLSTESNLVQALINHGVGPKDDELNKHALDGVGLGTPLVNFMTATAVTDSVPDGTANVSCIQL